ncbi:hypothetical protein V8F20_006530 [Naviculisporaceae sp. PSN 640]
MALLARLGLTSLALLLLLLSDYAIATSGLFDFPSCVRSCMRNSETCPKAGARCLCRASSKKEGAYLSTVIECMANSCSESVFRDAADASFLGLMEAGCKALHKPIGRDILDKAEEHVSKLYTQKFHLPTQTEKPAPTTAAAPPAKETTDKDGPGKDKGGGGKETTQAPKPTTTAGSDDDDDDDDDGTASETASPSVKSPPPPTQTNDRGGPAPETPAVVPNPAPPAPTIPPANPDNGGFVDDTPFGDPLRSVAGSSKGQTVMALFAWAVLPLAVRLFV